MLLQMNDVKNQPDGSGFEQWSVVEVFGHQKYAGLTTEKTILGRTMAVITVPEADNGHGFVIPEWTKILSPESIFSITPVSEEYARKMASALMEQPISGYEHGMVIRSMADQMVQKLIENQVEKSLVEASSTDQNDDPFL